MFTQAIQVANRYEEQKKRLADDGKIAIEAMIQEFFGMFPNVYALTWYQYTPYFNDGDPCTFRLGDFSVKMTEAGLKDYGLTEDDCYNEDDCEAETDAGVTSFQVNSYSLYKYVDREKKFKSPDAEHLANCLNEFDRIASGLKQAFEAAYGDHKKITVTRTSSDIEDYDHD